MRGEGRDGGSGDRSGDGRGGDGRGSDGWGEPHPEAPGASAGDGAAREATLALLAARAPDATVCPSEVARAIAPTAWRDAMPAVHAAVDALLAEGAIRLSWRATAMPMREGPYRIGRVVGAQAGFSALSP